MTVVHHTKKERLAHLLSGMERLMMWVHSREGHTAPTVSQCRQDPCVLAFSSWINARVGDW
jgi:hypothetical protein